MSAINTMSVEQVKALKEARRASVRSSFESAKAANHNRYLEGDPHATAEYVWANQVTDATNIVSLLTTTGAVLLGITKQPQVGMTGLLHYIPYLLCTHENDDIVVAPKNVCILTGMSNVAWETDTKRDFPDCFQSQIFHHGKLRDALPILRRIAQEGGCVIIDEIQNGAKENQVLHQVLIESGLLNMAVLETKNVKIVTASATMIKHIHTASQWGGKFTLYKMTIPENYLGYEKLKQIGVLREWKNMNSLDKTREWFNEIETHYDGEFRVHLVRSNAKMSANIQQCVLERGFGLIEHNSKDRLTPEQNTMLFHDPLNRHWIILVKGFWRAANRIATKHKFRVGSVHEQCVKRVDNDVQAQGLPGRMLGYPDYPEGHKIGPYYTSLKAIDQYIAFADEPESQENAYQCAGYTRTEEGVVRCREKNITSAHNIANLQATDGIRNPLFKTKTKRFSVFQNKDWAKAYAAALGYQWNEDIITQTLPDSNGFIVVGLNGPRQVHTVYEVVNKVKTAYGIGQDGSRTWRTCLVGYLDKEVIDTAMYVVVIRPNDFEDKERMTAINAQFVGKRIKLDKYNSGIFTQL
jgi:hypothetical protein